MKDKKEIAKAINLITTDSIIFGSVQWFVIEDRRGSYCAPRHHKEDSFQESLIKEVFDSDPALYHKAYKFLRSYHERYWLWKTYVIRAFSHLLENLETASQLVRSVEQSLIYRQNEIQSSLVNLYANA